MRKIPMVAMALLFPVVLFAQAPLARGSTALKRMGLTDDQISKVNDIVKSTETEIRDDMIHIKLIKAQIDEEILPSTAKPDMGKIDKLIEQESKLRGDIERATIDAEVQLIQIMGSDNFQQYYRELRFGLERFMSGKEFGLVGKAGPGARPMTGAPAIPPSNSMPPSAGSSGN